MSDITPAKTVPGNPSSPSILFLNRCVEQVFTDVLDPNTELFPTNATILADSYAEFKVILQQVRQNNYQQLLPTLIAGLQFILGREAYENNDLEATLYHYRRSLEYWPSALAKGNLEMLSMANRETILPNRFIEQMGGVLFHLGLCFATLGQSDDSSKNNQNLQEARNYFEKSLEIFEKVNRPDLMSKFIGELSAVLKQLEEWEALQKAAQKAIQLHISYGSETQLAKDYGFLAEAALHESKWAHANQLAELALAIQGQSAYSDPMSTTAASNNSYLYLLTESKQELQQWETTVEQLEEALKRTSLENDPKGYLRILTALHKLYFDQDLYIQASRLKEEKIKIEYQYGLRAFIGVHTLQAQSKPNEAQQSIALEIENSDRLTDVQALFERIQDPEHKLIILHGESGAGKSSLLNAGIVPKLLEEHSHNSKVATPILLRIYTDWLREPNPKTWNLNSVVNLLKRNDQNQIPTVLIFDQFEEFFVVCKQLEQRLPFYQFLKESLSLDSITILLSLRNDALHYLLECDRLTQLEDVIQAEILSKKVLYGLENFTLNQAKTLIQNQIARAQFNIEPDLMNQLIQDLTVNIDQIRPIELQLIGTQIQSNDIQTLEQYKQLGEYPRQKMLEQFLDEIIRDCSAKNERTVIKILNVLTNEQEHRPLKTSKELAEELNTEFSKIEPLLAVLVEEGLILHLPDIPDDRYQLTHDYLVGLIRQQKGERLIAQLELERDQAQRKIIEEKPNSFVNRAIASVFRWINAD
ncbi:nSTAND1 domain-containing NTPase [Planktothrix paucivesiculata]|uniref:WD-40 repeat protein n=1 Tax=Planktothrix paucivesiculata PCC 9631 TaxID=671071 RepID=A0A7Z9DZE1_9CYAN|nr:ATP-binding protein [Planktothrix paucivesiculata]VXD14974.1 WD-40 repeat protein [Planktothrix paucivesiculata PCC 9631]